MRKVIAVLFVLGAACGDGGGDPGPVVVDAPPVSVPGKVNGLTVHDVSGRGNRPELTVGMEDYAFDPAFIKAARGQSLSVRLKNDGDAPHTFTTKDGLDEQVAPGRSTTIDVPVPDEGSLVYFCRFHQGQGMQGAVYADDASTGTTGPTGSTSTTRSTAPTTTPTTAGGGGYGY